MELKHEKKTVFIVDYYDLDTFVSKVYNQDFEFVADHEADNYSSYEFKIKPESIDEYHQKKIDAFVATGKGARLARWLMTDMCNAGLIEAGSYLIKVSW